MSSPAELLALKHAQAAQIDQIQEQDQISSSNVLDQQPSLDASNGSESVTTAASSIHSASIADIINGDSESTTPASSPAVAPKRTIDVNDLPALGAGVSPTATALSWGPAMKAPAASSATGASKSSSTSSASANKSNGSFTPAVKSSTTQVTFIIDGDQQLNVSKPEIAKIVSKIKANNNVNIESTFSTTSNKRTFLIRGTPKNVKDAKREVLKQLTKPIKIVFTIPARLRSTVIGSQGRTLKPIIEATSCKIDIGREGESESATPEPASASAEADELEDIFGSVVEVIVQGDIEGCEETRSRILAIVNEHSKKLSTKLAVEPKIKPFVESEFEKTVKSKLPSDVDVSIPSAIEKSNNITISGSREDVIEARNLIKSLLEELNNSIVIDERSVPKQVHQFLNSDLIFAKTNVKVEVPDKDLSSTIVKFIGKSSNISEAISYGKSLASDYITDNLDLGRSHGGNILHAKCLASYFIYTKFFDELETKFNIKINAPSYSSLDVDENQTVSIQFVCNKDNKEILKSARKEIVDVVNKITPSYVKIIDDIESFVFAQIDNSVAISNNVTVIPLGKLGGFSNKLILIANQDDDEFAPSIDEINSRLDAVNQSFNKLRELSKQIIGKVIELPNEDQKKLENNNTLRLLTNKFEPNTIEIKLFQNKEGPSDNEIYLRGLKKEVTSAIRDIEQAIEDIKNYEVASKYNISVEFPTKLLSRLIGQKGSNLNAIRDEFDVKIDVSEDNKEEETAIKLTGLKTNVDECDKKLQALKKKWLDEKNVSLFIEQKYHRKMIGPSGVYVNRLQDRYNVIIKFPYEDSEGDKNQVIIRGPSRGVAKVEEELKELYQFEKENGVKDSIKVPANVLPRVIGKEGETINDIRAATGTEISITTDPSKDKDNSDGFAEFELIGSRKGIKEAKDKINSIIENVQNHVVIEVEVNPKYYKRLIGPNGSVKRELITKAGGDDSDRRLLQVPKKDSTSNKIICAGNKKIVEKIVEGINQIIEELENITTIEIEVPKKKHRLIIGPIGSIRREIQSEFKVNIDIPKVEVESDIIKVTGSPANCEKAKAKIEQLTK
ncbi:hypothetical protein B5S31_g4280 [[Candida] boidinii]|nr:hypothetical protein B5S31_g4280 [[Candida] boidinii]